MSITNCKEINEEINEKINEEIIIKKLKKSKTKITKIKITPTNFIIEEDFINQINRKDVLINMLSNTHLTGAKIFELIMTDNYSSPIESRQGWLFETLCIILIITKCIIGLNYTEILDGQVQHLKQLTNFNNLLNIKIAGGGNNKSDMTIKDASTLILFSIKYKNKFGETDVSKLDSIITTQHITEDYKIGLIVKDKNLIIKHKYNNQKNIDKQLHDKIIENGLLSDESDIIKGIDVFRQLINQHSELSNIDNFIEHINTFYLLSPRQQLVLKLHQKMTLLKFINVFLKNKFNTWCVAHKPRSGKSITLLLICKFLLEIGYKKILIMTPVPGTINYFVKDLDKYIDFKSIEYKIQDKDELDTIDTSSFNGIIFCSVQYLKSDKKGTKKDLLKRFGFDAIITDESHQGASTDKTKMEILDVSSSTDMNIIEDIRKQIKLNIFASGTAEKTKQFYKIHPTCLSEWEIEDEAFMKELVKTTDQQVIVEIKSIMNYRHGPEFLECLEDKTLNQNYSKCPVQVLMKHSIPQSLETEIIEYNIKNGTDYGYSCSSLFALRQVIEENGTISYAEEFEICKDNDGIDILKSFFDCIISNNRMRKDSIMKQIEQTQTAKSSRKSTIDNPLLFLIFLPTHTRNNTIDSLQKTLKKFLQDNNLWSEYNIEFSNSIEDSGDIKEEYNDSIQAMMHRTKEAGKRGCILLLGNKGGVGITYNECDVTIHLDDGHNLDNDKQRKSRSLTEAEGKTIGINVDMNIQRIYLCIIDIIQKYRKNTKTTKTNAEILYYLYEHNIFLFNPHQINYGKLTIIEIITYFQTEAENIMDKCIFPLVNKLLDNIVCDDDMRDFIKTDFKQKEIKQVNKDLEGLQQNCPKGGKTLLQIDNPNPKSISGQVNIEETEIEETNIEEINKQNEKIELLINQTYEMCKGFLFPVLALISKSYKIFDFKDIFLNEITERLIILLLKDKKIELNDNYNLIVDIMKKIIDTNSEIVNNIREIYSTAPSHKLRELIEKHFIPTYDEKHANAEVPTPVILVDKMLDSVPSIFWKTPQKVFEPCCGKGNFVLGIFDRFWKGLENLYLDEIERCRIIMTECIYYADLTALNVFITTEIMKCHIQSYCSLDDLDIEFNTYTGDTLKLNFEEKWSISLKDVAIFGNPAYSTDPSKPDTMPLYDKFIDKYIDGKLLLFVVPSRWFVAGKGLDKFRERMIKRTDIVFIQHEDNSKKWFKNQSIEGGVNYFLKDSDYNGVCLFNDVPYDLSKYDCVIKPKYHELIDIVNKMENISKLYMGRYFGIETNDTTRFKDTGEIKCYVSLNQSKNRCKYLDTYEFTEKNTFWKVITARANGKLPKFGEKFIGNPNEVHSGSYISFRVNNEEEAKSLLSYMDTKFANYMLSIRKVTQDISGNTCKWIPLVPLDRLWTNDMVCEYLKIDSALYV